jgi:hypothetical protein
MRPPLAHPGLPSPPLPENQMEPPAPFLPAPRTPAAVTADLVRLLAGHGITGIYTATAARFAIISVTTGLTVWTDGRLLWCTQAGQRRTWPAADLQAAAASIAALARPSGP